MPSLKLRIAVLLAALLLVVMIESLKCQHSFGTYYDQPYLAASSAVATGNDHPSDDMESYDAYADVNGKNGGEGWTTGYVDKPSPFGTYASDGMEEYSDAANVDGLNKGSGWDAAYEDK